jgi:hypothetical protein
MFSSKYCIQFSIIKKQNKMNRVNGCLHDKTQNCEILIALLIFDFLNVIRKLRHIFYCDVGFVLWYVLFHTRRITLLVKYFISYICQEGPKVHCGRDHVVARFPTTSAISAYHL